MTLGTFNDTETVVTTQVFGKPGTKRNIAPTVLMTKTNTAGTVSGIKKYFIAKEHPVEQLKTIFNISKIYYFVILLFVAFTLILKIFINIKKQHPHIIMISCGLIGVLTLMILI